MPETEVVEPVHAPAEVKNVAEVKTAVAEAATPLDNGSDNHSAEKAVTAQKPKEIVADTAAPPVDGGKKSFAAMVSFLFSGFALACAVYAMLI